MSERKDEQWLDDQLQRVVAGSTPAFDAETWKRKHAEAYNALTARVRKTPDAGGPVRRRVHWIVGGLAAAAAILIGVTVLRTWTPQDRQESSPGVSVEAASPASIVSMISLRMAYRQGGEEALNRQLDMALDQLGPRPDGLSTLRVVRDLDG